MNEIVQSQGKRVRRKFLKFNSMYEFYILLRKVLGLIMVRGIKIGTLFYKDDRNQDFEIFFAEWGYSRYKLCRPTTLLLTAKSLIFADYKIDSK